MFHLCASKNKAQPRVTQQGDMR